LTHEDAREPEAERIASLVGALLADSVVHLTGHAVGLTATDPQRWHNVGDNGCFMDLGGSRDYAERAGRPGAGSVWCPENAAYLSAILPRP
jgi:hypothetical protein